MIFFLIGLDAYERVTAIGFNDRDFNVIVDFDHLTDSAPK
jgi:hypothetical protein